MKKITLVMLLVVSMVLAISCAKKDDTTASSNGGNSKAKKLIMATSATFPPYEYIENGKIIGIDAEIAEAVAKKMGVELEIMDINFDSIIPSVMSGKADVGFAGMTVTEDRKKQVDFSNTYAKAVQSVLIPLDSQLKTLEDLKGKKIGVQQGTTGDIYATGDFGDESMERFVDFGSGVAALSAGKIDAIILDNEPAKAFVALNKNLKILETPYADEEYAAAVKKGNADLLKAINETIDELKASGEYDKIVKKYIHE